MFDLGVHGPFIGLLIISSVVMINSLARLIIWWMIR